jgi:methylase of polypeptide subunit release factors
VLELGAGLGLLGLGLAAAGGLAELVLTDMERPALEACRSAARRPPAPHRRRACRRFPLLKTSWFSAVASSSSNSNEFFAGASTA